MNLFTEYSTTRFCADLTATIDGMDDALQKGEAIAAAFKTFLNAHSYARVASIEEKRRKPGGHRFSVPYPIFVSITDFDGVNLGHEPPGSDVPKPKGASKKFPIGNHLFLVVEGAEALFAKLPWLENVCVGLAEYAGPHLKNLALARSQTGNGGTEFVIRQAAPSLLTDRNPKLLLPLIETLDLLTDSDGGRKPSSLPRWAWLAKTRSDANHQPYVYLYWPSTLDVPTIVNPDGSGAIVHRVLQERTPRITWNYAENKDWKIPDGVKEDFKRRARADELPHLLYVPVLKWLALQISFGPEDDPLCLLDRGEHLAGLAPVMLLNCFQDALFQLLLELFWDNPALSPERIGANSYVRGEVDALLQFVLDVYPVPFLTLATNDQAYPVLEPAGPSDPLAKTFALHGNGAIRRAIDAAVSHAQAKDYRKFGSTVMGTIHTLKRPLENMLSYTQRIESEVALSPDLKQRTREMIEFLNRLGVFTNLEVEALSPLFEANSKTTTSTSATSIIGVLRTARYDQSTLTAKLDLTSVTSVVVKDPVRQMPVKLTWDPDAIYPAPAGLMALIIAELVDNATKYLEKHPQLRAQGTVDVALLKSGITVSNPLKAGDKEDVKLRLERGCRTVGRSLNRVHQLAGMVGLSVVPDFPSATQIRMLCSPVI
jgi:hypothetical protein